MHKAGKEAREEQEEEEEEGKPKQKDEVCEPHNLK